MLASRKPMERHVIHLSTLGYFDIINYQCKVVDSAIAATLACTDKVNMLGCLAITGDSCKWTGTSLNGACSQVVVGPT
jgi:hypothetical protein